MPTLTLDDKLRDLQNFTRSRLVESWQSLYGDDPPKGLSTRIILFAVAYELQAPEYGRLPGAVRRKLQEIAAGFGGGGASAPTLSPGTRLVREWQGRVHIVDVMEEGFAWDGRVYSSLSMIAREITGTRWSGPRFFGLKSNRGRVA